VAQGRGGALVGVAVTVREDAAGLEGARDAHDEVAAQLGLVLPVVDRHVGSGQVAPNAVGGQRRRDRVGREGRRHGRIGDRRRRDGGRREAGELRRADLGGARHGGFDAVVMHVGLRECKQMQTGNRRVCR